MEGFTLQSLAQPVTFVRQDGIEPPTPELQSGALPTELLSHLQTGLESNQLCKVLEARTIPYLSRLCVIHAGIEPALVRGLSSLRLPVAPMDLAEE